MNIKLTYDRASIAQMIVAREIDRIGHKLHAPTGVGIVRGRIYRARLDELNAVNDELIRGIRRIDKKASRATRRQMPVAA